MLDDNPLAAIVGDATAFRGCPPERPTLYERPPIAVTELFDLASCAELIEHRALRSPTAQMARTGNRRNAKFYTWAPIDAGIGVSDEIRPSAVNQELEAGSTLILNGLHRYWTPIRLFCAALGRDLGVPVNANAYLTPAHAQGFAHHHDTNSSFVVQCEGEKTWQLYRPVMTDPLPNVHPFTLAGLSAEDAERLAGAPDIACTLHAGDVLWLPRGWIHNAFAEDKLSLHVTISLVDATRHWLARRILDWAVSDDGLRGDLPPGFADGPEEMKGAVAEVLRALATAASDDDSLVDHLLDAHRKRFPAPTPRLAVAMGEEFRAIGDDGSLHVHRQFIISAHQDAPGTVTLGLGDRSVTVPGGVHAVHALLAGPAIVSYGRLRELFADGAAEVVSVLVREGVADRI